MRKYSLHILNRENLESKEIGRLKTLGILSLGCILFYMIGFVSGSLSSHPNEIEKFVYDEKVIIDKYNEKFTEQGLKELLVRLNVKNIDIVMAQSRIETGNYKSKVFLENNNLFGMKEARQRVTTAIGTNLNHAEYKTWQESAIDYAIYQSTYLRGFNKNQYLEYLKANYAENKQYVNLINKFIN